MKNLAIFLDIIECSTIPPDLRKKVTAVEEAYNSFLLYLEGHDGTIYGTTTLPGHRDNEKIEIKHHHQHQYDLILNHRIGKEPYFDSEIAICISLSKAFSVLAGCGTVSGNLLELIFESIEDNNFSPDIPLNSSYSSGDVIPAAHWAFELLLRAKANGKPYELRAGEGMALLNGSFVHMGVTAALCKRMEAFWKLYLTTLRLSLSVMGADSRSFVTKIDDVEGWCDRCAKFVSQDLSLQRQSSTQEPVSIRGTIQCLHAATSAIEHLFSALDHDLGQPSGNPLYLHGQEIEHTPSGSFLNPSLTIHTGAIIEILLLLGWASVGRINYILGGKANGIPLDAASKSNPLGMIQWPKNAQAKLEHLRRSGGIRAFVSGGSTSYGIEDLWTNGVQTSLLAINSLEGVSEILALELYIVYYSSKVANIRLPSEFMTSDSYFCNYPSEINAAELAQKLMKTDEPAKVPYILTNSTIE